jgi:phage recombination protein Bet
MTQQRTASTAELRNKIEKRNNVQLLPTNEPNQITYHSSAGTRITLSPTIVRQYLVNGQGNVSDQEVMMFLKLCEFQGLNPFLREAYLIKYGQSPASIVVGKELFTKRAERHVDFKGFEAGIYVMKKDGNLEERKGAIVLPHETLVGGWAKVYRNGYNVPIEMSVGFDEYVGRKGDGTPNAQWSTKPATMIRKVALVQALREAFPAEFGGMYSEEEIYDIDATESLPIEPLNTPYTVDITPEVVQVEPEPQEPQEQPQEDSQEPCCEECGVAISDKVAKFSRKMQGRSLCMSHQKQQ